MYVQHPSFRSPNADDPIWRYLSLTKFLHLLAAGALWFCRSDLLGDSHEGALPRLNAQANAESEAKVVAELRGVLPEPVLAGLGERPTLAEFWRHVCHVSSWHLNTREASWMWKSYVPDGQGVALRSDFAALRSSFGGEPRPVYVGLVGYLDYELEPLPWDNAFVPVLSKRREFEGERELRAIVVDTGPVEETYSSVRLRPNLPPVDEDGDVIRPQPLTPPEGVPIAVDLGRMIHEVRVAPGAGEWAASAIRRTVEALGFGFPVNPSSIDTAPRF